MRRLVFLALACAACGSSASSGDDDTPPPDAAPDTELQPDAPAVDMSEIPTGCLTERSTVDRADDSSLDQVRFLYVVPSDIPDGGLDTNGKICNSIRAVATWFHNQTGSYLRLDTQGGLIDIGFVRLTKTDAEMRGNDAQNQTVEQGIGYVRERIERELTTAGLIGTNKLYGVFYDGTSSWSCGGGAYPPMIEARVGAMYLRAIPSGQSVACGSSFAWGQASLVPSYIDYGILHELMHSMGIVAATSPNQQSFGHVYDTAQVKPNTDLMYTPRPGMPDPGWATYGLLHIDLGGDDYFHAGDVDLAKMSLLSPLPDGATRPAGW
jgi:hypothetical protein